MVHVFRCLGADFALDTESGALVRLDKTAKNLIEKKLSPCEESSGDFFGSLTTDENNCGKKSDCDCDKSYCENSDKSEKEAAEEIEQLIADGILFCPAPAPVTTSYTGVVKSLCLNISHNCNLRCIYCFADGGSYSTPRCNMSGEVAHAAIDFLIAKSGTRKNLEVDFFGGEPLLNLDVVKSTVEYAKAAAQSAGKTFRFTLTTNGVGLTDEIADYLNREMYNVVISIDGREKVHNSVRPDAQGKGSFEASLKNAQRFRQKRGDKFYYIRGTFTALNKDFAADALALNDYGFDQISLEPVVLPAKSPMALAEKDLDELKAQYELLGHEYLKRRKTEKWFNFFHFMLDMTGGPCLKKRITGCGAGSEYLAIAPSGDIYPCHRFDGQAEYKIGNVLDGTFDVALPKMFAKSNVFTKENCTDCFCKYYCSGGCAANSIEHGGGIEKPYKIGCELMKKRTEVALAVYALENEQE